MSGFRGEQGADDVPDKYRIILPLGQGGTADVYLAAAQGPRSFRKLVVLKILKDCLASDPEFRSMFLSEARLAARLHHANVVQTNEVIDEAGAPIMVMEYLEGQPLSQVIVRGKSAGFTLGMQLRVLADALGGLHAAHELADFDGAPLWVVHRDVSPQNLFVTFEGQAKVLDFGIAKLERSIVETEIGTVKGKLRYMAPEQIAGEKLDRRADLYAAGVILWEALAGGRMWRGVAEPEIRTRVIAGDLPPLPEAGGPGLEGGPAAARLLREICRRALSLRPEDRQPSALALADELESALRHFPGAATSREIGATVARLFEDVRAKTKAEIERKLAGLSFASAPEIPLPPTLRADRRRTRSRLAGFVGMGLALATLGVLAARGLRRTQGAPPAREARVPTHVPEASPPNASFLPPAPIPEPSPTRTTPATSVLPPAHRGWRSPKDGSSRPVARRAGLDDPVAAAPLPVREVPAPGNVAATTAHSAGPAPDCAQPFFVDVDGIKKFRRECM